MDPSTTLENYVQNSFASHAPPVQSKTPVAVRVKSQVKSTIEDCAARDPIQIMRSVESLVLWEKPLFTGAMLCAVFGIVFSQTLTGSNMIALLCRVLSTSVLVGFYDSMLGDKFGCSTGFLDFVRTLNCCEEDVRSLCDWGVNGLVLATKLIQNVLLWDKPLMSMKVLLTLWTCHCLSCWISVSSLLSLSLLSAFTVPYIVEKKWESVSKAAKSVLRLGGQSNIWGALKEKTLAVSALSPLFCVLVMLLGPLLAAAVLWRSLSWESSLAVTMALYVAVMECSDSPWFLNLRSCLVALLCEHMGLIKQVVTQGVTAMFAAKQKVVQAAHAPLSHERSAEAASE